MKLRRKYKIEEGTKLAVIDTKEGILQTQKIILGHDRRIPRDPATAEKIDKHFTSSGTKKKMNKAAVYDTRFFIESYQSKDERY